MKQLTLSTGETIDVPETRGDCANIPRPCPFNNCRHHLEGEVPVNGEANGSKWLARVERRRLNMVRESCALDVVDIKDPENPKRADRRGIHGSVKKNRLPHEKRRSVIENTKGVRMGINHIAALLGVGKQSVHKTLTRIQGRVHA